MNTFFSVHLLKVVFLTVRIVKQVARMWTVCGKVQRQDYRKETGSKLLLLTSPGKILAHWSPDYEKHKTE